MVSTNVESQLVDNGYEWCECGIYYQKNDKISTSLRVKTQSNQYYLQPYDIEKIHYGII